MGSRLLPIVPTLFLLLLLNVASAWAQDSAVGGWARVKRIDTKTGEISYVSEGVKVEVKGKGITDTTNSNGVYVLYIPGGVGKKVNLRFTYGGLEENRPDISIDAAQKKITEVELKTTEARARYDTPQEIERRVFDLRQAESYAETEKDAELAAWAKAELKTMSAIGAQLSAAANAAAERNETAAAARLYERAIVFQKAVEGRESPALVPTYEGYSTVLMKSGDAARARQYSLLALEIRGQKFTPLDGPELQNVIDRVPRLTPTSYPVPIYPDEAKARRIQGKVEVEVSVDWQGGVVSAKAVSGPEMLREAAVQAALRAKFDPRQLQGGPPLVKGIISFDFALRLGK